MIETTKDYTRNGVYRHELFDRLGDEICELVSMSDSHSLTLGWLLLADAQAHMWDLAMGDLKQIYIQIYT